MKDKWETERDEQIEDLKKKLKNEKDMSKTKDLFYKMAGILVVGFTSLSAGFYYGRRVIKSS